MNSSNMYYPNVFVKCVEAVLRGFNDTRSFVIELYLKQRNDRLSEA